MVKTLSVGTRIIKREHVIIDCDLKPFIPSGWAILPDTEQLPNRICGQFNWDPKTILLHLDRDQKPGWKSINGIKLHRRLAKARVSVLTANVLDYLLKVENQHRIPEEWKQKEVRVFFWGTIYSVNGGLCVRCLCRDTDKSVADDDNIRCHHRGRGWMSSAHWLGDEGISYLWTDNSFAACIDLVA